MKPGTTQAACAVDRFHPLKARLFFDDAESPGFSGLLSQRLREAELHPSQAHKDLLIKLGRTYKLKDSKWQPM